jgi:hypothetical protein
MASTVTRTIRFAPDELAKLERIAAARGETVNDVVRSLVRRVTEPVADVRVQPVHARQVTPIPKGKP